jgi:P27 family predicted phage terminase small subunit
MPGPAPTPTALKKLKGNPSKTPLNPLEPKPKTGEPVMPRDLSKPAKKEWKRLVKMLLKLGVLTVVDGDALAALCEAKTLWREALNDVRKNGIVITVDAATRNGPVKIQKKNPAIAVMESQAKLVKSLLESFGCTPSSRTRVSTNPNTDSFSEGLEEISSELDKLVN